ncbi:hypothetical protein Z517_07922 [Fonsecaea pedrosoi CBS 271.37]|uniref:Heterokaryon incompatibility domain-containing protein n=1 Tax=Fonsecaea pedrosoi CBS 271.37 TaxID=1442368 RepID=A0A0D2H0B4_9EURO|nr:uncharacterized protein Z517_07922 [Fonsecaea pedrosoi CBS 271.37]KIW78089.1 hypothetical protein Z517_07922 [Fonsecaea pedrosoi CBS 271.37]
MRLLQCDKSGKFILTKDLVKDIPPFAILSHTWGADTEEVTYRDIVEGNGETKAGYDKIRFCGERAKRDGLEYFWVDTCCIDKSNSTELAEAINSMFRWYHDAAKCYTYLSDVSGPASDTVKKSEQLPWKSQFRKSRWFTRGWTLQELVAPRTIEFFSKEHCLLGDKRSLEQIIHETTGIALEALRKDRPLHDFSVDERMSWVRNRNTTRPEDAAYCLLGIFGVYMPLIYGEGQERALRRLWKEFKESPQPQSVLSKDVRSDPSAGSEDQRFKPFTSSFNDAPVDLLSIHFMDRQPQLTQVRDAHQVCEENLPARCALWGIPGVGKTQLAIRYSKMFLEGPTVSASFWISCSTLEKVHLGFSRILDLIDHPDQFKQEQNARIIAARRWLEQPEVSGIYRWLLVLDNVDMTTIDFLRENLPRQGRRGRLLITTRTEAVAQAVCKASGRLHPYFEIKPPTVEDSTTFFFKSVGVSENSMSIDGRRQVTDLMKCLGCLPFAVEHVASFMSQSRQPIEVFTRLYQGKQKSDFFNWQNLFSAYEVKSISGIFQSHLHSLRRSSPEVYGLLNILVFWDPERIEFETIKTGAYFLLSSSEPTQEPSKLEQNRHWTQCFIPSLIKVNCFGFASHSQSSARDAQNLDPKKGALLSSELESMINMMSSEVRLQSALQQLQMFSLIKRRSAEEGGAYSIHDLTQTLVHVALESEGTYLQWFKCAVTMACGAFREIENPNMPEYWHKCDDLISHTLSLTKYGELVDPNNAEILTARGNAAAYWCERGRYHEAREMYRQILRIGSTGDTEAIQWELGLAQVNWHLSNHSESALLYEQVLRIRQSQLGADHPDVLQVVENLALVYRSQARYEEARSMLEHVLESRRKSLGRDDLVTVQAIENLAIIINESGEAENDHAQYLEAESLHKLALTYREAQLGADHLDSLWTADNLATNYRAQGRHMEALEIYKRVLKGRISQLGEDHPQTLWTVANLASAYTGLGRLQEAEAMYRRAIVANGKQLGHDHTQTLWVVEGLADVYHQHSRFEEATTLYNRALRGMQGRVGAEHPSVMRIMHKLANLYRDGNDVTKSINMFERVLELRKSGQRSGSAEILRTYHDAAATYVSMGMYNEAEQCYRQELAQSAEELSSLHVETKKREQKLADFLKDRELQSKAANGDA